jgi:hypothetical protein
MKYEPRLIGGSGGPAANDPDENYGVWEMVLVEEVYWEPCEPTAIFGVSSLPKFFDDSDDGNGFDYKDGSGGPDQDFSNDICDTESKSVRLTNCPEHEDQVRKALFDLCKSMGTIQRNLSRLKGCSDKLDKLIECITSRPWTHIREIDCSYSADSDKFGHTDTEYDDQSGLAKDYTYKIGLDVGKFNSTFKSDNTREINEKLLSAFLFHEIVHVCSIYLKNYIWGQDYAGELEAYLLTYIAFGDFSKKLVGFRKYGNVTYQTPLSPDENIVKADKGYTYYQDVALFDVSDHGTSSQYYDLVNQYSTKDYVWSGIFIWDPAYGHILCWDPWEIKWTPIYDDKGKEILVKKK